ncbi:MAG: T9SS type A sorting domain-containing protein [Chlorobi bacterium]|nr:T9SS type A sorting domain-containing protein [Chlorobiota bacterium]
MKLKFFFAVMCGVILIAGNSSSQDVPDWVWKSPMTKVYPTGEYTELPPSTPNQLTYQNPNTTTRVVNQNGQYFVLPPNVRPFPDAATQSEVDADNMAGNTQVMYCSWNSWLSPTFFGCGFAYTNNGGTSWTGARSTFSPNSGDPGPIIWPAGSSWPGRLGLSVIQGFGHSDNGGSTWTFDQNYSGGSSFDKNLSDVDDISGSPFFGRAYTVWTYFSTNRIYISYSTNGGVNWTVGVPISPVPVSGHHHQGCDVEVGPGGVVYVVWANCLTNGQNSTEDFLGFAKSTDGGVTWTGVTDNAVDINGIRTSNLFNGIRANGFPRIAVDHTGGSRNGWIYVTLAEKNIAPATDVADVTLCRSTNGGTSWTHTRVNQDAPANGKFQYFPDVDVASDGSVCISYYDQRNTTSPVTEYWLSRSLDGGNTWTDVAASDHTFTPAPIPGLAGGYQGDYTGITTAAGKVWPFWADNSSGVYQVWTVGITIGPPPANDVIVGPFLSFPSMFVAGTAYNIRSRVTNGGTNGQTNLPMRFIINGVVTATNTIPSLPPSAIDSTTFSWTPSVQGTYTLKIASGAPVDENRLNDTVTATVQVLPQGTINSQTQLCRNGLNIVIPALGNAAPDSIVVNIANAFNVVDVNVRLDTVIHTWVSDLAFNLRRGAANVTFVSGVGGSGDNFIQCKLDDSAATPITSGSAPFTGTWRPTSPLTPLNGQPVNGSWVLQISDLVAGDSGFLRAWCIQVTYQTLVGGIQTTEIPNYYSLSQNYPNPFNPSTTIRFSVPKNTNVTLKVYDVLGKEVAVLVNELKQAGFHTVDFDASHLASGIYFYKIEAGDFNSVKKMILVK